jgi:hypothetical protein
MYFEDCDDAVGLIVAFIAVPAACRFNTRLYEFIKTLTPFQNSGLYPVYRIL